MPNPSPTRVALRHSTLRRAGVIDEAWVEKVRKAWKVKSRIPMLDDDLAVKVFLGDLVAWLDQLAEDILFDKGFWSTNAVGVKYKVVAELKAAREALQEGLGYTKWLSDLMSPSSREYQMEGGWTLRKFTEEDPKSPRRVMHRHVRTRAIEAVQQADTIISRKMLSALTRALSKSQSDIDFGSIPLKFSVGRVTVVFQGFPALLHGGGPLSSLPRTPSQEAQSRHPQTESYLRYLDEAQALLKKHGLGYLWYGDIYIRCKDCGGENPLGAQFTIGAHYFAHTDHIQVYMDPVGALTRLLIHEIGHRYYYKFMTQADRAKFDSYFQTVPATTEYGATISPEDFAEVFADYVTGRGGLSRDQVDRFKAFLGRSRRMAGEKPMSNVRLE